MRRLRWLLCEELWKTSVCFQVCYLYATNDGGVCFSLYPDVCYLCTGIHRQWAQRERCSQLLNNSREDPRLEANTPMYTHGYNLS